MPYKVEFRREAVDDLRHLDKAVAQRILRWLRWLSDNFDAVTPEALTIHFVGHRKDIYRKE